MENVPINSTKLVKRGLPGYSQAEPLSRARNKYLATTYKDQIKSQPLTTDRLTLTDPCGVITLMRDGQLEVD